MSACVEVWPEPGGSWRWRYVDRDETSPVVLVSNTAAATKDEAVSAARTAYPDLPLRMPDYWAARTGKHPRHRRLVVLVTVGFVLGAVAGWRLRGRRG